MSEGVGKASGQLITGGPLVGVRVLDLTGNGGRFATKILAEFGADVVRVRAGDCGPAMKDVAGGLLDWWFDGGTALQPLDLGSAEGRETLRTLVAAADVLLESEGADRMAALGFGSAELSALNPRLSHVKLTPWGSSGPRAGWQSSDLVMSAASGLLSVNGDPDEPVSIWGRQMDNIGGFYAAICALTGLFRARATGRGTHFDLSQQQAALSCTEHLLMFHWYPDGLVAFGAPKAVRQASLHWIRAYEVVACARGHCMVSPSAGGVPRLIEWMIEKGHAPVLPPPVESGADAARLAALMSALHGLAKDMDATDLFHGGQDRHVPFGEVYTIPQVAECTQHEYRNFFRPVVGAPTRVRMPGPMAHFSLTPCAPAAPPPTFATAVEVVVNRWTVEPGPERGAVRAGNPDALPLAGVRVIDFTHVLAGPFATRVLADLGAHVVKIQTEARTVGAHANEFPYFAMWNRSKDSVTLNMADPGAPDVLRKMVEQADVLIENFSAGVLDAWGVGWAALQEWNPKLTYVSMQGAGTDGPWRDFVTFAPTIHALCGLTSLTGPEGRLDCGPGVALNDHMSGLAGAVAILAALEARSRTGVGQHVDLSQFELGTYLVGPALLDWFANGREAKAAGTRDPFTDPVPNDVVPTAEGGWLAVTARDDIDWAALAGVLGAGSHLATVGQRRANRVEVRGLLATWAAGCHAEEAAVLLQAVGVPAYAVLDAEAIALDPQLMHRDWIVSMASPTWGTQPTDRFPAVVSDVAGEELVLEYRPTPYLGEHTLDVFEQLLGLDAGVIAEGMGTGLFN